MCSKDAQCKTVTWYLWLVAVWLVPVWRVITTLRKALAKELQIVAGFEINTHTHTHLCCVAKQTQKVAKTSCFSATLHARSYQWNNTETILCPLAFGWPNGKQLESTCMQINQISKKNMHANLNLNKVSRIHHELLEVTHRSSVLISHKSAYSFQLASTCTWDSACPGFSGAKIGFVPPDPPFDTFLA